MTDAIREIFNRIPALRELRGAAQIDAENVIANALADAAEDGRADALLDCHDDEIAAEAVP